MTLKRRGKNISKASISVISEKGFWLLAGDKEYFIDYGDYPWFKSASVGEIMNVDFVFGTALVWPDLDVDLELASLERPEDYPLTSKGVMVCKKGTPYMKRKKKAR